MVESEIARLHAIVEGHVQGVGFRMFVQNSAVTLGINGWVRNLWNGNVELMIEGERDILENLLGMVKQGPRSAYVINVHSEWDQPTNEFTRFQVLPTA